MAAAPFRYILFNKPYGVLSQFTGEGTDHPTLADFVEEPGVYPAGRLDHDSEGLLLLTDDGALQHLLTEPRFAHPRTYWAQVEGLVTPDALRRLAEGVTVRDYRTRPALARLLDPPPAVPPRDPPIRFRANIPDCWIELVLTEGRNRQVRRMTAAVGFPTLRLIRAAIGAISSEGLDPGKWRHLRPAEVASLLASGKSRTDGTQPVERTRSRVRRMRRRL